MDRDVDQLIGVIETEIAKSKFDISDSSSDFQELLDDIAVKLSIGSDVELYNDLDEVFIATIDLFESCLEETDENKIKLKVIKQAFKYSELEEGE
jgi:hypothetical protein